MRRTGPVRCTKKDSNRHNGVMSQGVVTSSSASLRFLVLLPVLGHALSPFPPLRPQRNATSPGWGDTKEAREIGNTPLHLVQRRSPKLLYIGVNTAPGNFERRQEIRHSWMQDPWSKELLEARFMIGRTYPRDDEVEDALAEEQRAHQDIIRLDVPDTYDSLSNKTLQFLRSFRDGLVPDARFVMKLDDDTFPHVQRLLEVLRKEDSGFQFSYMGYFHRCAQVRRSGKNAEPASTYAKSVFPTYASGSGYILSSPLARKVVDNWESGTVMRNEDANVGVLVDEEMRNGLQGEPLDFREMQATLFGCNKDDVLSMNLEAGEMGCMWQKARQRLSNICCRRNSLVQVPRKC